MPNKKKWYLDWSRCAPYWHVGTVAIGAIGYGLLWFHNADNAVAQTAVNTSDIVTLKQSVSTMQQEVHDIHDFLLGINHGR